MIIPHFIDFVDWANSLIIDFPFDPIPILYNKSDWRNWGNQLILCDSFYQAGAPGTLRYDEPFGWANDIYLTMLNYA